MVWVSPPKWRPWSGDGAVVHGTAYRVPVLYTLNYTREQNLGIMDNIEGSAIHTWKEHYNG